MVNLVLLVEDLKNLFAELRVVGLNVDRHDGQLVIARAPCDVFAVRAEGRAATVDAEVDDFAPVSLDQQVGVAVPHAGVNGGDDPFAVWRVADVVKVMQPLGVDVLACVAARQMMKANALGVIICDVELRIFLRQEGDGLAVGRPA